MFFSLTARENPFFPSTGEVDLPLSSNIIDSIPPLKRATITLPSTARTIQSVTVTYKKLDGSIEEKTEILQNTIDWHLPIFLTQNYGNEANIIEKKNKLQTFIEIASLKFISLSENSKHLKIITKDKMIRNFLLVKPHRIVCDFKRDIDIRSFEKEITKKSLVTRVKVGNHKGYYRMVIELDGYYRYSAQEIIDGYVFTLE